MKAQSKVIGVHVLTVPAAGKHHPARNIIRATHVAKGRDKAFYDARRASKQPSKEAEDVFLPGLQVRPQ